MRIPLAPPAGLNSDETSFARPGTWEDGSNVRFRDGKPQVLDGILKAFAPTLGGICRNILSWTENDGTPVIAFGTHSHLYVYKNGGLHDITPTGLAAGNPHSSSGTPGFGTGTYGSGTYSTPASDYYARTWSLDTYGQSLIACPRGGTIYQWNNDVLTRAAAITGAPAACNAVLVTPERQLLAFGCKSSSGAFNALAIRGSDIENITDWTPDTHDNAFEHILEGGGRIVSARLIGSYVAVWTNNGLHMGQFIGNLGQAYRFDRVGANCGLIAPNAVHVVNQSAFWLSPDYQFRGWGVGGEPTILNCPIWKDFVDNLTASQLEKVVASGVSKYGEVWFHYPDARDGNENSRYVAFNTATGTWFKGILPRSAASDAGVVTHPILAAPTGEVFYHEHAQGTSPSWFLKSSDQYLDEGSRAFLLRGIRPDFESQSGAIDLTLFTRRFAQGDVTQKGPYSLAVSDDRKDFLVSAHIVAVQFAGSSYVRLGKPVFDAVPTGMNL